MKVVDLMSRSPITVSPEASFDEVWKLIFAKRVSGIPVVDRQNSLLGIISEEDLIEKLYPSYADYFLNPGSWDFESMEENLEVASRLRARDFMNKHVYTTTEDAPIMKAASSMLIYKVSCLPVVRDHGRRQKLVGIICKGDIFGQIFRSRLANKKLRRR